MKDHEFTIIASGLNPQDDAFENLFFEAGCDDATLSFQKGVIILEFHRQAESFARAVASAYEDVLRAGATVERIEPDHLVSLSEIAERSGLTRQAISLYTRAERGQHFPGPVAKVTSKHPLWDGSDTGQRGCAVKASARSGRMAVRKGHAEARGRGPGARGEGSEFGA